MMRYDSKERLNIDILYNHEFLRKNVKEFTKLKYKNSDLKLNIHSRKSDEDKII